MGGCAKGCAKTILTIVNIIFFLAGAAILGGALYIRFEPNIQEYTKAVGISVLTSQLYLAAYVLIGFGAFTFVVGFLGCYGAIRESKCALGLYIAFIVVILGAECGGGALVYASKDTIIDKLTKESVAYLKNTYVEDGESISDQAWDFAMQTLACCGVNGISDFDDSQFQNVSRDKVPTACCKNDADLDQCHIDAASGSTVPSKHLNTEGCKQALSDLLTDNALILLGIAIGVAVFELFVILMAACVCCNIEDDKY